MGRTWWVSCKWTASCRRFQLYTESTQSHVINKAPHRPQTGPGGAAVHVASAPAESKALSRGCRRSWPRGIPAPRVVKSGRATPLRECLHRPLFVLLTPRRDGTDEEFINRLMRTASSASTVSRPSTKPSARALTRTDRPPSAPGQYTAEVSGFYSPQPTAGLARPILSQGYLFANRSRPPAAQTPDRRIRHQSATSRPAVRCSY